MRRFFQAGWLADKAGIEHSYTKDDVFCINSDLEDGRVGEIDLVMEDKNGSKVYVLALARLDGEVLHFKPILTVH